MPNGACQDSRSVEASERLIFRLFESEKSAWYMMLEVPVGAFGNERANKFCTGSSAI